MFMSTVWATILTPIYFLLNLGRVQRSKEISDSYSLSFHVLLHLCSEVINNRACGVAFYVMGWFPYATGQIDDSSFSCLGRTMIRTMTLLMPPSMHYNNSYSLII